MPESLYGRIQTENKPLLCRIRKSIQALQSAGIFHRDLHSGNIMVDDNEKVSIIDFGNSTRSIQRNLEENLLSDELSFSEFLRVGFE